MLLPPKEERQSGQWGKLKVALAPFLRSCSAVITLGVRASIGDYSKEERDLLLVAERVFFPTLRFAVIFQSLEKSTFPSLVTYRYQRSRLIQSLLFQYLGLSRPRTRIYFGKRQKAQIVKDFQWPVVLMGPQVIPGTNHMIHDEATLALHRDSYNPLIVQQGVPWTRLVRFLCIHYQCVGAQCWDVSKTDKQHYTPISLEDSDIREALGETEQLTRLARLDDIVIEWGYGNNKWQVKGMARPPVKWSTPDGILNRHEYICKLIRNGVL